MRSDVSVPRAEVRARAGLLHADAPGERRVSDHKRMVGEIAVPGGEAGEIPISRAGGLVGVQAAPERPDPLVPPGLARCEILRVNGASGVVGGSLKQPARRLSG